MAIAERMSLPVRRVRYVLDHRVMPDRIEAGTYMCAGDRLDGEGRGVRRTFLPEEAFAIGTAALMIASGIRRNTVASIFDVVCGFRGPKQPGKAPFHLACKAKNAVLEIANGELVRVRGDRNPGVLFQDVDSGWIPIEVRTKVPKEVRNYVAVTVQLSEIKKLFQ
jgi:hypothetical protein